MAAADCVDGGSPPEDLRFAWRVEKWGDPTGEGWAAWPAGQIDRATYLSNVYNVFSDVAKAKNLAKWAEANPKKFDLYTYVEQMRRDI